jgi:hypothetical protein
MTKKNLTFSPHSSEDETLPDSPVSKPSIKKQKLASDTSFSAETSPPAKIVSSVEMVLRSLQVRPQPSYQEPSQANTQEVTQENTQEIPQSIVQKAGFVHSGDSLFKKYIRPQNSRGPKK